MLNSKGKPRTRGGVEGVCVKISTLPTETVAQTNVNRSQVVIQLLYLMPNWPAPGVKDSLVAKLGVSGLPQPEGVHDEGHTGYYPKLTFFFFFLNKKL